MKIESADYASRLAAAMPRADRAPEAEPDGDREEGVAAAKNPPAAAKRQATDPEVGTKVNLFA
jgi:hypothetical protein